MTRWVHRLVVVGGLLAFSTTGHAATEPEPTLSAARDLYASAAYEEALAALDRLRASADGKETASIDQYRAFCLMALGRPAEAQTAMEAVVTADPLFRPADADVSPRVRTAFTDVRRRLLPGIAEQRYARAKAAFDQRDFQTASAGFVAVIAIVDDPVLEPITAQPRLADMRTLASGFQELSAKLAAPQPAPPVAPQAAKAVPPPPVSQPPSPPRVYTAADANVLPPTVVRQDLPAYSGRAPSSAGVLEVVIDEQGMVEAATIKTPINPAYDKRAVAATRAWRYNPASVGGVPVKFRKTIQITIAPAP